MRYPNLLAFSLSPILSVALAVLVLLVMVTVHEFGHYIAGKILKFKINEFSVGFGPKLLGKTNKKTGEKFSLRLIPLGGYCAFEDEDGLGEDTSDVFEKAPTPEGTGKKFCEQPPWKRIIVLLAGATMNYITALVVIFIGFFIFGQTALVAYEVAPSETYALEYSLHDKDILLEAEGRRIYMVTDLMNAVKDKKEGEEVHLVVSRRTGDIRKEESVTVQLRAATNFENSADTDRLWQALGLAKKTDENGNVLTDESGNPSFEIYSTSYKFGFLDTLSGGFAYSFRIAGSIFKVLGELFTGALGVDTLGGPVTTIAVTSQIASMGIRPFLEITAYIGVNLAVFNLLPIPALDGSKIVFTAIEWVRGKPLDRKIEAIVHTVGFLLIFAFAIFVDILQLV